MTAARRAPILLLAMLCAASTRGVELELSPDVPATLSGTRVRANQTATSQGGGAGYTVKFDATSLGASVNIDALTRLSDSTILFSTDAPFSASGTTFGAADVAMHDGVGFSMYRSAASMGITTASANVDGLALDPGGELLLSFQTPTSAGAVVYQPSDIAIAGVSGLSLYFDANAAGLPAPIGDTTNVNGFEIDDGGVIYITCDVHVILGGSDLRTGQVISYDPSTGSTATFWQDTTSFATGATIADFSFKTPAGSVPATMTVTKDDPAATTLSFAWSPSGCLASAYAIYEGELSTLASAVYSHDTRIATVTGTSATGVVPQVPADVTYYIVVPRNGDFEGSYGVDSSGAERPGAARTPTGADLPKMSRGCS